MRVDGVTAQNANASGAVRPDAAAPRLSKAQPDAQALAAKAKAERLVEEQRDRAKETRERESEAPVSRSRIRVDKASNRFIAQVVNENNEVIKQYPPEAILKFTARFKKLQGLLFDEQA